MGRNMPRTARAALLAVATLLAACAGEGVFEFYERRRARPKLHRT